MPSDDAKMLQLKKRIAREQKDRSRTDWQELVEEILNGDPVRARGNILFHTEPAFALEKLEKVLASLADRYPAAEMQEQIGALDFTVKAAIDLRTFPAHWVLRRELDEHTVEEMADRCLRATEDLLEANPEAAAAYENKLRKKAASRLQAEGAGDEQEVAGAVDSLFGADLLDCIENTVQEVRSGNLFQAARKGINSSQPTEIGNDYAAFLERVIWSGGSFVTTNPVLIKLAWDIDRYFWDERVDNLIRSHYTPSQLARKLGAEDDLKQTVNEINSLVTMAVVEENCRLLRDIFLVTGGSHGYVSLQVNPCHYNDRDQMVAEAHKLYGQLEERLGGVPNVVFKIPATTAGRYAAGELVREGIGVTITLTFSAFQALGFAEALKGSSALTSYIALMNGLVAFPIRDQLAEEGVEKGEEAARWAGVAIARKIYSRLYDPCYAGGMGLPRDRIRLLIASLRIYAEDWLPDISELWGVPVITFFPDVRRIYDRHPRHLDLKAIRDDTPPEDMHVLLKSEMFRQAWWLPGEPETYAPKRPLELTEEDAPAINAWTPVDNTLNQFIELYQEMGDMVRERIRRIANESGESQQHEKGS